MRWGQEPNLIGPKQQDCGPENPKAYVYEEILFYVYVLWSIPFKGRDHSLEIKGKADFVVLRYVGRL